MLGKYIIEQMAPTRWFYSFEDVNEKKEKLVIELIKIVVDNPNDKKCLPYLWKKHGYIDRVLPHYWSISTYVHDTENNCYGIYNPQSKRSDDGKRNVINFDWIFEATEENKQKLLEEVYNRFMAATGKTATEKKIENVYNHAKKCGHEVYKELPEGWKMLKGTYAPLGSVLISNGKSFRDKERKEALLLI